MGAKRSFCAWLLLCFSVAQAAQLCVLPAQIQPGQSAVKPTGVVRAPLPGELVEKGPAALSGYVYVVFPTGEGMYVCRRGGDGVTGRMSVCRTRLHSFPTPHSPRCPHPTDACPTPAELPAALQQAQLATPKGSPGITTLPAALKASVTIADLPDQAILTVVNFTVSLAAFPTCHCAYCCGWAAWRGVVGAQPRTQGACCLKQAASRGRDYARRQAPLHWL